MTELLTDHETIVRLGVFLGIVVLMMLWELLAPRRALRLSRWRRWPSNLSIVVLNSIVLRLVFPLAATGIALYAAEHHWGLLNNIALPPVLSIVGAVILLDLAIYWQHRMMHAIPLLWRLHRMHHADIDFDVTTGARFHPIEIVVSMLIKFAVIAALGPPVIAVIIFEIVLNATSMFNHGNVRLPLALDRLLRLIIVTPDMHRVHHSVRVHETNSNYGFNLPWWDRLFASYRAQPADGHEGMTIGITTFPDPVMCSSLSSMLAIPFIGRVTDYASWRRSKSPPDGA